MTEGSGTPPWPCCPSLSFEMPWEQECLPRQTGGALTQAQLLGIPHMACLPGRAVWWSQPKLPSPGVGSGLLFACRPASVTVLCPLKDPNQGPLEGRQGDTWAQVGLLLPCWDLWLLSGGQRTGETRAQQRPAHSSCTDRSFWGCKYWGGVGPPLSSSHHGSGQPLGHLSQLGPLKHRYQSLGAKGADTHSSLFWRLVVQDQGASIVGFG